MGSLFRVVAAQILPCGGPAHRSDDEFRWRIARVFAVSLFAGAYFSVVALNNSADATSPFANFGRGVFLILGFKHEVEEEVAVMGGVPGRIFFRATVPHEDPLQLKSKTLDMSSMARRMNDAMEILENLRPQFQIMAR
eukprot:Polyplicarium_translucidae@DN3378_c1_g4_i4.p3